MSKKANILIASLRGSMSRDWEKSNKQVQVWEKSVRDAEMSFNDAGKELCAIARRELRKQVSKVLGRPASVNVSCVGNGYILNHSRKPATSEPHIFFRAYIGCNTIEVHSYPDSWQDIEAVCEKIAKAVAALK